MRSTELLKIGFPALSSYFIWDMNRPGILVALRLKLRKKAKVVFVLDFLKRSKRIDFAS